MLPNIMIEKHNVSEYNSLLFFNKVTKNVHFSQFPFHLILESQSRGQSRRTRKTRFENCFGIHFIFLNAIRPFEIEYRFAGRRCVSRTTQNLDGAAMRTCHYAPFFRLINRALSRARNPLPINDKFLWST